ncbi:MAG: GTPase HflX [Clostridia bacterium]|nr:GTPase HflX [Clostridia bacterium]
MEIEQQKEQIILVGVSLSEHDDIEESMNELGELVTAAGGKVVSSLLQNREQIHPVTYLGKGKIEELKELIFETDATGIVCDDELSPLQLRNLSDELDCKVMDRTLIILDIFASRATSAEGKIQVEMAQLRYTQTRLTGYGKSMSRLGGGIGTRGPGEKKIEVDRRLIQHRIAVLNKQIKNLKKHRMLNREQRGKNKLPVMAIVGYTNAGKSTLLNTLTGAGVLSEDQVFATLDPTTRMLELDGQQQILLTDTVGFIRKLPHHLIDAFRSTLEEAKYADYILHVVDASNPQMEYQMSVVYDTLRELGIENKTMITLFNKTDRLPRESDTTDQVVFKDLKADHTLYISAKTGEGISELTILLVKLLEEKNILVERVFPYQNAGQIQILRKYGQLLQEDYREDGIYVKGMIAPRWYETVTK